MQGVCIGDVIQPAALEGLLRGHGTLLRGDSLVASRCGLVQRWNQLVLVDPLAGGYVAAVGHVVVGRVVQVRPGPARVAPHTKSAVWMHCQLRPASGPGCCSESHSP
jgi:exosome complex RNA-binding protein Csl4